MSELDLDFKKRKKNLTREGEAAHFNPWPNMYISRQISNLPSKTQRSKSNLVQLSIRRPSRSIQLAR